MNKPIEDESQRNSAAQFHTDYIESLGLSPPDKPENLRKIEKALEVAHRIREFEISLYWQRTNYFWGFQAAFMAIIAIAVSDWKEENKSVILFAATSVSALAFLLALLWLAMAKGAKFWAENWERHVDLLETTVTGDLYKVYPCDVGFSGRPYSVSKINILSIHAFVTFWAIVALLSGSSLIMHIFGTFDLPKDKVVGIIAIALLLLFCIAMLLWEAVRFGGLEFMRMGPRGWKVFDMPISSGSREAARGFLYKRTPFDKKDHG